MFIKTNNRLLKLMMSQQKSKSRCVYIIESPAQRYRHAHKHWHLLAHLLAKPQREKLLWHTGKANRRTGTRAGRQLLRPTCTHSSEKSSTPGRIMASLLHCLPIDCWFTGSFHWETFRRNSFCHKTCQEALQYQLSRLATTVISRPFVVFEQVGAVSRCR